MKLLIQALAIALAFSLPSKAEDKTKEPKPQSVAYVRILHAITNAPTADVYFDNDKVAEKMTFKTITDYIAVKSSKTTIKMAASENGATILDGIATFAKDGYYTVAPYGTMDKAKLTVQNDNTSKTDENKARIRIFNLAPGALELSFAFTNGDKPDIVKDVEYGTDTTRLIAPGTLIVQAAIKGKVIYEMPNVSLDSGKRYTLFAVGKSNLPHPQAFELLVQAMGGETKSKAKP